MANKKAHTIIDVFLPDGYGAFGYGAGGFGGTFELLNPQWNTNSGSYGIDPVSGLPFVEATSTPSFVGATAFDISYDSFFAKIQPAPAGNGSIQTGLLVKFDAINFVQISVGPSGVFNAFGSNNNNIVLPSTALPTYDPVAHAYWRIRNDGILFHFDASPDGATWTELANVPYTWDATNVSVMIFAGFNGSENPGSYALISHVNLPGTTLQLSATTKDTSSVQGLASLTSPGTLSATTTAKFGVSAKFTATLGLPEGAMSDFAFAPGIQQVDPIIASSNTSNNFTMFGINSTATMTRASWATGFDSWSIPVPYRDGSYFPPTAYLSQIWDFSQSGTTANNLNVTNNQTEFTIGYSNRLPFNSCIYSTGTFYAPGPGTTQVVRSTAQALNGQYSGAISSSNSPITLGNGSKGYFPWPTSVTLMPWSASSPAFGQVYLSTARAGTQWFTSFIFYDANFNVLSGSTYQLATIFNIATHPGSNVWQANTVSPAQSAVPAGTAWVGVVPVIINNSNLVETVYTSNPGLFSANLTTTEKSSTYNNPNTQNINIKADRVNYVLNGGFNNNLNFYSQVNTGTSGTPNPVTLSWDGTTGYQSLGSAKMTFVTSSGTFTGTNAAQLGMGSPFVFNGGGSRPVIQGLKVGHTYTVSAWIKQGPGCPDVFMNCLDQNFAASNNGVAAISTNAAKSAGKTVSGWTQITGTFTVPTLGLPDMGLFFYVKYIDYITAGQNFSFWVDSILLEESASVGNFFDGGTATADYQWESGGTANASRSYYYSNFTNKVNRLNTALPNVLPIGSSYNLLFAQPILPL